jgi:hypothetical protein
MLYRLGLAVVVLGFLVSAAPAALFLTEGTLAASSGLTVSPGDSVTVVFSLTGEGSTDAADASFHYDPAVLQYSSATTASALSGWSFMPNGTESGVVYLSSNTSNESLFLNNPVGTSLFYVNFQVLPTASPGVSPITLFDDSGWASDSNVSLASGSVNVVPEPSTLALLGGVLAIGVPVVLRRRNRR